MDMSEMTARTDRIQRQIESLEGRMVEVEKSHSVGEVVMTGVDRRLGNIEDTLKWIVRLIVGAIVMSFLGFILSGGLVI